MIHSPPQLPFGSSRLSEPEVLVWPCLVAMLTSLPRRQHWNCREPAMEKEFPSCQWPIFAASDVDQKDIVVFLICNVRKTWNKVLDDPEIWIVSHQLQQFNIDSVPEYLFLQILRYFQHGSIIQDSPAILNAISKRLTNIECKFNTWPTYQKKVQTKRALRRIPCKFLTNLLFWQFFSMHQNCLDSYCCWRPY